MLFFIEDDPDIRNDELFHTARGVFRYQPALDIADRDRDVRLHGSRRLAGVTVHAAVDIDADDLCLTDVNLIDRAEKRFSQLTLKACTEQAIYDDICF